MVHILFAEKINYFDITILVACNCVNTSYSFQCVDFDLNNQIKINLTKKVQTLLDEDLN